MKSPKVICVSASDRYNYGDLLFPIVAEYQLSKRGISEFENVAIIDSDLSDIGALPTKSYEQFFDSSKRPQNTLILVAGGEVINSEWMRILSFIRPSWRRLYEKYNGPSLKQRVFKRLKLYKEPMPFVFSSTPLIKENSVVYHAVGGSVSPIEKEKNLLKRAFNVSPYVSVRERETFESVKDKLRIHPKVLPDSVITYSDIMPKTCLKPQVDHPYICVQLGYEKARWALDSVLEQLQVLSEHTGLPIGLLSIGNCPGHDDEVAADWIQQRAKFDVFKLRHTHIDDITSALAHARLFVGTSLHGIIVSMTYGNPFVALDSRIRKLHAYSTTWAPDYLKGCVDYSELAAEAISRLEAHADYSALIEEQKQMVRDSFHRISELAHSAADKKC